MHTCCKERMYWEKERVRWDDMVDSASRSGRIVSQTHKKGDSLSCDVQVKPQRTKKMGLSQIYKTYDPHHLHTAHCKDIAPNQTMSKTLPSSMCLAMMRVVRFRLLGVPAHKSSLWSSYFFLAFLPTMVFSVFPALNAGTTLEGTLIFFPVCGFIRVDALRVRASNLPNPVMTTGSFFESALVMRSTIPSTALRASFLVRPASSANCSTNSVLFTLYPLE